MFELSVASKYLTPRWRQLSVSIISTVSILVIALVVWLIIVFFSVTDGLEKTWIQKLIALTAPVRITPTEAYMHSYYYQIDTISSASDFASKSIAEKLMAVGTDPYDPSVDEEIPARFPAPDRASDGSLKDVVKMAFQAVASLNIPGVKASDFEMTTSNLRLELVRSDEKTEDKQSFLSQVAYVGSFDRDNNALQHAVLPTTKADLKNVADIQNRVGEAPSRLSIGETEMTLPPDGILLPKSYRDAGALLGDRGMLSYYAPTTSSMQEHQLAVHVAGFYDPGIIPIGGKYVLANREIVSQMRSAQSQDNVPLSNGINVRFDDLKQADKIKAALQEAFKRDGIDQYWRIETYREFDFTKDLIQQLGSEKNLWSLIATIIIIVACSNIISMLIILVNDKKLEIGILRSMGASAGSIAMIFGFCGVVMGLLGSLIGTVAAVITLRNLQTLLDFISRMQGYEVFNPVFYGNVLPNEISYNALLFVIIATSLISLLAGIIPAIKASLIRPSSILKSE